MSDLPATAALEGAMEEATGKIEASAAAKAANAKASALNAQILMGALILVGVAVTGNVFGLSLAETQALAPEEFAARRASAVERLNAAGAHYVIDGVADILPVVQAIDERLGRGERP